MAATGTVLCQVRVVGLGGDVDLRANKIDARTPGEVSRGFRVVGTTDVVLGFGTIANSTVLGLMVKAEQGALWIYPGTGTSVVPSTAHYLPEGMANVFTFNSLQGILNSVTIQGSATSTKMSYVAYGIT
ncbi:hypothetical protein LCGC14_1375040 [marine sediment metagenome]|uniref:Uncharacterized protein n=1 Tax=marine sediment metagenome TaxID=412755 RepID=A0A0F9K4P1_9ZZZZ